jgi:hypothetical protein
MLKFRFISKLWLIMIFEDFKDRDGKWVRSFKGGYDYYVTPAGRLHNNMKNRCTVGGSEQRNHPSYEGSLVSDEFLDFQYFANWCQHQTGYNNEGWHLDKDLLFPGNREYHPDRCIFLPHKLNQLFKSYKNKHGLPCGVARLPSGMFSAKITVDKMVVHLGTFDSAEGATDCYMQARKARLASLAEEYKDYLDFRAYESLIIIAEG